MMALGNYLANKDYWGDGINCSAACYSTGSEVFEADLDE
jgi:hypothetical protein